MKSTNKTTRQLRRNNNQTLVPKNLDKVCMDYKEEIKNLDFDRVCCLVSGGDDSISAYKMARKHFRVDDVLHINTGTGIELIQDVRSNDTRTYTEEFVKKLCINDNQKLIIKRNFKQGETYEDMIMKNGLPSKPNHFIYYSNLKERCINEYLRETKGQKILFISGTRMDESKTRERNIRKNGFLQKKSNRQYWFVPLANWNKQEVIDYVMKEVGERCYTSVRFGSSGECMCGATSPDEETFILLKYFPRTYQRILRYERMVQTKFGIGDENKSYWGNLCKERKEAVKVASGKQLDLSFICSGCEKDKNVLELYELNNSEVKQ